MQDESRPVFKLEITVHDLTQRESDELLAATKAWRVATDSASIDHLEASVERVQRGEVERCVGFRQSGHKAEIVHFTSNLNFHEIFKRAFQQALTDSMHEATYRERRPFFLQMPVGKSEGACPR